VHPELVKGTLREGFKRIALLEDPFAQALMAMYIVTEVHPFVDGNGRTARLAMNAYLTQSHACRIIIPTAYREDYLLPLKALSQNANPEPFVRAMTRAWYWTAGFDYSDVAALRNKLNDCNAFAENLVQYRLLDPTDL
jgi:fido (protein-threonine AMPylation protein)